MTLLVRLGEKPIRSLAYFGPLLEEVREADFSASYGERLESVVFRAVLAGPSRDRAKPCPTSYRVRIRLVGVALMVP